jgi:zinc/manganese transport system substrate-binding protein
MRMGIGMVGELVIRRIILVPARPLVLVTTVALAAALSACGGEEQSSGSSLPERPVVVATTTQLGDIVREIAGKDADVHQILQPNSDPHEYEPRAEDVQSTVDAKLVVESGNGLDHWMGEVVKEAGGHPTELVIGPDHLPYKVKGDAEEAKETGSEFDPHWWHDPRNVEAAVETIRDALAKAAPGNADTYRTNADAYLTKLKALDSGIEACMSQVPAAERKLVTSHDAFNYFTARYGITVIGAVIPSQSTQAQPSAGEVAKLADVVRREHVKAVFPESSINPKLAETLARETGAKSDYVLYGDTLGPAGSPGDSYLKMEAANADAMVKGFTGEQHGCAISGI